RHDEGRDKLRARPVARAIPEQGPAWLAGIRRAARAAFEHGCGADHARGAEAAAVAVRSDRRDENNKDSDADHDWRRRLAMPRAGAVDEADDLQRRPGGDS